MKQMLKRTMLVLLLATSGLGVTRAQFPVTDLASIMSEGFNALNQLLETTKQLEQDAKHLMELYKKGKDFYELYRDIERTGRTLSLISAQANEARGLLSSAMYLTPSEQLMIVNRYISIIKHAREEVARLKDFKTQSAGEANIPIIEQIRFWNASLQRMGYIGFKVSNTTKMWQTLNNNRHSATMEEWRMNALLGNI